MEEEDKTTDPRKEGERKRGKRADEGKRGLECFDQR